MKQRDKTPLTFVLTLLSLASAAAWADDGDYGNLGNATQQSTTTASREPSIEIPRDAALLYQERNSTDGMANRWVSIRDIQFKLGQTESKLDIELQCQVVYYEWFHTGQVVCDTTHYGALVGGCFNPIMQLLDRAEFMYRHDTSVNAYCQERSYDQKVIMSLLRRCEQNPTAECLDEKIKVSFRELKPTLRYNINKPTL